MRSAYRPTSRRPVPPAGADRDQRTTRTVGSLWFCAAGKTKGRSIEPPALRRSRTAAKVPQTSQSYGCTTLPASRHARPCRRWDSIRRRARWRSHRSSTHKGLRPEGCGTSACANSATPALLRVADHGRVPVPVTRDPANATRPRHHPSEAPGCCRNRIHAHRRWVSRSGMRRSNVGWDSGINRIRRLGRVGSTPRHRGRMSLLIRFQLRDNWNGRLW